MIPPSTTGMSAIGAYPRFRSRSIRLNRWRRSRGRPCSGAPYSVGIPASTRTAASAEATPPASSRVHLWRSDTEGIYGRDYSRALITRKPRIAITLGDPAGIGPEIAAKAADDRRVREVCEIVPYGVPDGARFEPGVLSEDAGRAAYQAVCDAVGGARTGLVVAVATGASI